MTKESTALFGNNVAYIEGLENDEIFQQHELAKASVIRALNQKVFGVASSNNDLLLQYQLLGSRYADLNPLQATSNELEEHTEYVKKYCGKIAYDYKHIVCPEKQAWWQDKIDAKAQWCLGKDQAIKAYTQLQKTEQMEHFLSRKYVGQTRFSLEGCDALIPLLDKVIEVSATNYDVQEVVLGMPHRGRLNVMLNIMGMSFKSICDLYSGVRECVESSSDVTYHMGYSSDRDFSGKDVHLSLAFNPSHLEFIVPVVMGSVKARQKSAVNPKQILPLVMHGDAAVAGQGVVAEWFNMMSTEANYVHGAIHVVVNNQIGFTTDHAVGRSGFHPTDAHKYADIPVVHVNADDVESVIYAATCAAEYRAKFGSSVIINLLGYRRFGHNEGDDPNFTQPKMYSIIKQHKSVLKQFEQNLLDKNLLSASDIKNISSDVATKLKSGACLVETLTKTTINNWDDYNSTFDKEMVDTSIGIKKLKSYVKKITSVPENFNLHKQVEKLLLEYNAAIDGDLPLRWGLAEQLAYVSLLDEGFSVRMVGQDVERGTFSHRHAVWTDQENNQRYSPLDDENCAFYNSTLSEQAVVAFEYGYSLVAPKTLNIWEAQYGDFCNGAQVIIDQFISSSWQKWQRMSGLVMFLPHGYEGAGPEHSSARLERFLQLAAQENMRVCMPSNAAQIFHLLRLQMLQSARIPLIVMTPKSSLRLPAAMSDISCFTNGSFATIINDDTVTKLKDITRVILCSGKIYYDLDKYRNEQNQKNVAIVRIEQLYPFDESLCKKILSGFKALAEVVWCQEEPRNQGSWYIIRHHIEACLPANVKLACVSRGKSASPAAGYKKLHQQRQAQVVENSFKEI